MNDEERRSSDQRPAGSALAACLSGDWTAAKRYRYAGYQEDAVKGQAAKERRCSNCGTLLSQTTTDGTEYWEGPQPPGPRVWTVQFADMWSSTHAAPEGTLCSLECASEWIDKLDQWVHWPGRYHRWIVKV